MISLWACHCQRGGVQLACLCRLQVPCAQQEHRLRNALKRTAKQRCSGRQNPWLFGMGRPMAGGCHFVTGSTVPSRRIIAHVL